MSKEKIWGFDWFEFLFGILLLVAAVLLLIHPSFSAAGLAVIGVILLLVAGIKSIWEFRKLDKYFGLRSYAMLIVGLIEIVIAVVFMFEFHAAVPTLGILFALFVIVDAIGELFVVSHVRKINGGIFWGSLLLDVIVLLLGILLLVFPTLTVQVLAALIAIILIIIAINMILLAFAHKL